MAHPSSSYSIFPLGDSAITIDFGNCINEDYNIKALAIYDWLQARPFSGLFDVISAYSSVTIFYDPSRVGYTRLEALLRQAWEEARVVAAGEPGILDLPVCYEGEYAPDVEQVAAQTGLSREEVIQLHTAEVYRVYMIGFLPGFPYLGRLNSRLDLPRKAQPVSVPAGGVGIASVQTGIYPLNSPGGWWIIGRTPVTLFDAAADPPALLRAGDRVRFRAISPTEFRQLDGRRR